MPKHAVLSLLGFVFATLVFLSQAGAPTAIAGKPLPPNDRAKGLVYDGLQVSDTGECKGGFKIQANVHGQKKIFCTHGPDAAPPNASVGKRVAPLKLSAPASALALSPAPVVPLPVTPQGILCDGDGTTGNRVQVIYAHASDVPDNYATYLPSFQRWVSGVDQIYNNSAAQTGGSRHVRFVTDANCNPVVPDVTLSSTGDDSFANTINELIALGYNRLDRKYLIFTDAHVYCGISTAAFDDQPGPANLSNQGYSYGRVDAGCWMDVIAAHELTHQLGAVQFSAPHSDGNWHCNDGYDTMCDYAGHAVQVLCSAASSDSILDCNHDDYFNTNPPAGSYLATHWNVANNTFLISPAMARVNSVITGKLRGKNFVQTDNFTSGETVIVQAHVVDQSGASLAAATVNLAVDRPDGILQCSLSVQTDAAGMGQGSCPIPHKAPPGSWQNHLTGLAKSSYMPDFANSVTGKNFNVK